MNTLKGLAVRLAGIAKQSRDQAADTLKAESGGGPPRRHAPNVMRAFSGDDDADALADLCAQTIACGLLSTRLMGREGVAHGRLAELVAREIPILGELVDVPGQRGPPAGRIDLGSLGAHEMARALSERDVEAALSEFRACHPLDDPLVHFYELFLTAYDAKSRRRRGVFYTPRPIVSFIVGSVDEILRREFGLQDGLADTTTWGEMVERHPGLEVPGDAKASDPLVRILDPATGTGTFLVEVICVIHRTMTAKWRSAGHPPSTIHRLWNEYVPMYLLPRLHGLELLPVPWAIAHMKIAGQLGEMGYCLGPDAPLRIGLGNALREPGDGHAPDHDSGSVTVVLGNPPFCGISNNRGDWINGLLKGRPPDGAAGGSYYEVDGRPLGEKKLWLTDDYVKFFRYAQWRIHTAGCGVLGYVSNHGYLDNPTFRGMRQRLMETFARITVIDLHGNRKKKERAPDGGTDEGVFLAEQGVAIGLFRRLAGVACRTSVRHGELWGSRDEKYERLLSESAGGVPLASIRPTSPYFFFYPRDDARLTEYERGYKLTDIMPVRTTAVVTARDRFVIAFDERELLDRMRVLRDGSVGDGEIRTRYFQSSRSAKYAQGDTRSWKLAEARARVADDPGWQRRATGCLYRPFDHRKIYWADWMIDWPRTQVMRHLVAGRNVALIARRQMLPSRPCNFFGVTDQIAIDGVIRSDNRGSESLFPLYIYPSVETDSEPCAGPRRRSSVARANFAAPFIDAAAKALGLKWIPIGRGDLDETFGPEDLLHFIYGTFHSPTYRTRFAEHLRTDFPRVFLPENRHVFRQLCDLGADLVELHLVKSECDGNGWNAADGATGNVSISPRPMFRGRGEAKVARGYPKYSSGRVSINRTRWFEPVSPDAWNFHVGAHQVCRKWLKDRRGRALSAADVDHYRRVAAAVAKTIDLMSEVDRVISQEGAEAEKGSGKPRAMFG